MLKGRMRKQVKSNFWEKAEIPFMEVLIGIGVGLLFFSGVFFFVGWHNLDLSHNMVKLLGEDVDLYVDQYNSDGDTMTYSEGYILGAEQMTRGFLFGIAGGLLCGFSFCYIGIKLREKK